MSPASPLRDRRHWGFPRVSGDEPRLAVFAPAVWVFSPRGRGWALRHRFATVVNKVFPA